MNRLLVIVALLAAACGRAAPSDAVGVPGRPGDLKTSAAVRAQRRAFDGAPPVIPHTPFGADCRQCHNSVGMAVPGVGFAPPSPHETTAGMGPLARCEQCHVWRKTEALFAANTFTGLPQDLRHGRRLTDSSPPVIPHQVWMRENCQACHAGPAAREEIRCTHPERTRCQQCHVAERTNGTFARP